MRVYVYFEDSSDGLRRIRQQAVDSDYLEDEMDAIEYRLAKPGKFRFIPSRSIQIDLINEFVKTGVLDPLKDHWPFRREFINQQTQRGKK